MQGVIDRNAGSYLVRHIGGFWGAKKWDTVGHAQNRTRTAVVVCEKSNKIER